MPEDFIVTNHGSIYLFAPMTEPAKMWVRDNLPEDRQTWADAVVVEHRYIADIVEGARQDGLTVA